MADGSVSTLSGLTDELADFPNVWGEGLLFAFSGLDGETCSADGPVASLWSPRYDLLFHLQQPQRLRLRLPEPVETQIATNDVLVLKSPNGPALVTWSAWHTLVGVVPPEAQLDLIADGDLPATTWAQGTRAAQDQRMSLLRGPGKRFAVGFGQTPAEAKARALEGLGGDPWAVATARLAVLGALRQRADAVLAADRPAAVLSTDSPALSKLLNKCLSVMRVNSLAAEGAIRQAWTTPDRVPHRHMWLWDSAFHSLAMSPLDPDLAWQHLKSVLDFAEPDGRISITVRVDGAVTDAMTQPPVLAWAVWRNYLESGRQDRLAEALPKLEGCLEWNLRWRRSDSGLLAWAIEDRVTCRCGESGMDNSPRFDDAVPLDSVDFCVFQARDMHYVSLIAREAGDEAKAQLWMDRAHSLSGRIHAELWDPSRQFYVDRYPSGRLSRVEAASGFLPLLLDDCPPAHVAALANALQDPSRFGTPMPVASVSRSHPSFSCDMWRGPVWINLNYLIVEGLRTHGRHELGRAIAERTVATVQRIYEAEGVVFEFYDALDRRSPAACDRKGTRSGDYLSRPYGDSIRDYHWSAALTACLLMGV